MATKFKITIGLDKYHGTACGFYFRDSVCVIDEKTPVVERQLRRLHLLFRGCKVEEFDDSAKPKPKEKPKTVEPKNPEPGAQPEAARDAVESAPEPDLAGLKNGADVDALKEAVAQDEAAKDEPESAPAEEAPKAEIPESSSETEVMPTVQEFAKADAKVEESAPAEKSKKDSGRKAAKKPKGKGSR